MRATNKAIVDKVLLVLTALGLGVAGYLVRCSDDVFQNTKASALACTIGGVIWLAFLLYAIIKISRSWLTFLNTLEDAAEKYLSQDEKGK